MANPNDVNKIQDEEIDRVIHQYYEAIERGENVDARQFIADHPELAEELQSFFSNIDHLQDLAIDSEDSGNQAPREAVRQKLDASSLKNAEPLGDTWQDVSASSQGVIFPSKIGRYTILQKLGRGGQGNVYRAAHPTLPIEVAIKVGCQKLSPSSQQALVDEAHVLCDLDHPNIAKIRDLDFDTKGHPILVLELVRGRSLDQLLKDADVPVERTARWLADVADAVGYAHRRGVLHLDLKPGNIVIDEHDTAKVIDFGLARLRDAWSDPESEADSISGTPAYMSPEQSRGLATSITAKSDVFALGAILYRVLTGLPPFQARTPAQAVLRSQRYDVNLKLLKAAPAPRPLIDGCLRAMSEEPSNRFDSAEELAEALRVLCLKEDPVPSSADQTPPGQASTPLWRRPIVWASLSLMLLLMLAGMFGFSFLMDKGPAISGESNDGGDGTASSTTPLLNDAGLDGDIHLTVIRDERMIPIEDPLARPLQAGDGLRIEAILNQSAYFYLIWIDETGEAQPFYPGTPGNWQQVAATSHPEKSVVLPEAGGGYQLTGQSGMQTILLLARSSPLAAGEDIRSAFFDLPEQSLRDEQALVYIDGREFAEPKDRGADFSKIIEVEDPVLQTQAMLKRRLADRFSLIRAVSVGLLVD